MVSQRQAGRYARACLRPDRPRRPHRARGRIVIRQGTSRNLRFTIYDLRFWGLTTKTRRHEGEGRIANSEWRFGGEFTTKAPRLQEEVRSQKAGCRMQDAGCRMRDAGCGMRDAGCRMQDAGCRMRDAGCRMQDARCRMQDAGCRMQDAGCRMEGRRQNAEGRMNEGRSQKCCM